MNNALFLDNNRDTSFLAEIKRSLKTCKSFEWTVSFIKKAGLVLLINDIEGALTRGAKGKVLTSTYQNFTDIGSLEMFFSLQERFPNQFKCHLENESFESEGQKSGFHTKGYLFHYDDGIKIIIGSSNLTRFALLYNKEWDLAVSDNPNSPLCVQVQKEFDYLWAKTGLNLNRDMLKAYAARLQYAISAWDMDGYSLDRMGRYKPNAMQKKALEEIRRLRAMNVDRALIVAATGSGKTFLSAFDAMEAGAKKLLFIVHKDMILKEAMDTYMHVFSSSRTYGMFAGGKKELDVDFLFATNVSIAQHLDLFSPDEFDYIVFDEVHHAAASTYQKIINYFKPAFILGMTATPDRMDNQDIYGLFGNNVPYDLRLRDAIENELIVPFRYYGIKDQYLDYDDKAIADGASKLVKELIEDNHIDFLLHNVDKHRPVGMGKLKCVGFCRTVEHARRLADTLNFRGRASIALSAQNSLDERMSAFKRLQDEKDPVEFVFAVDILNEGVDVPAMNMVLFLRPTESSTIFLQQLGRGLRKYEGKPYLTVLDFIGNNYTRAAQIALAFGTLTKTGIADRKTIQDVVSHPKSVIDIPGIEIVFDSFSKDAILASLENTNFDQKRFLKKDYENYKKFLKANGEITDGEFPKCIHYLNGEVPIDLMRFITKGERSYYSFLNYADPESAPIFSSEEHNVLSTLSFFLPLVRSEEFDIVNQLIEKPMSEKELYDTLSLTTACTDESIHHALMILSGKATVPGGKFFVSLLKEEDGKYSIRQSMNNSAFKDAVKDIVEYGLVRYSVDFYGKKGLLKRFASYTGAKVFLALNNVAKDKGLPNLMYMQGVEYTSNGLCLFINLNKDAQKEERLKYKDKFLSRDTLQWESQTGTTLTNSKGERLIKTARAHLFVRKSKKGDMPYIYLGEGTLTNPRDSGNEAKALLFDIILDEPLPEEYDYDLGYKDVD